MKTIGGFDGSPDFLLVLSDSIGNGDIGLVRSLVSFEVVKLEKDAQLFSARKFLAEPRADFVRVEDELPSAGLTGGDGLDLIGKD